MMASYGDAALKAVSLCVIERMAPRAAWEKATSKIFGVGTSSQRKGCPRNSFLGLCEEGLIKGIPPGRYTSSSKNKGYAVNAVNILKANPNLSKDELWIIVVAGEYKAHNQQMDVVLSLWKNGVIE